MTRRNFDRATKVAIIKRSCARREDGQPNCERCGAIGIPLEVHHKDMDAMQIDKSRKLTADDGELLCEPCHDPITAVQRKQLAKAQAREARALGAVKPKSQLRSTPFPHRSRPHEGRPPVAGESEIARRFRDG